MALPVSYESVSPVGSTRQSRSRVIRVIAGAAVMLVLTALVALAGQSTEGRSALLSTKATKGSSALDTLAGDFLQHGASMSVKEIKAQLDAFTKESIFLFPTSWLRSKPLDLFSP